VDRAHRARPLGERQVPQAALDVSRQFAPMIAAAYRTRHKGDPVRIGGSRGISIDTLSLARAGVSG
jgi:hypothetical protein